MQRALQPWKPLLVSASLATLAWLCFAPILHNSFLAEDFIQSQITTNPHWAIRAFAPGGGGYRPLMFVFWAATSLTWGNHSFPYRVVVVGLHLLNAALVYSLARQVTRDIRLGLVAGLLFITFPASVQAVNWLSAASNQVVGLFGYLLSLRAFVSITLIAPGPARRRLYTLCVAGLLLALGAIEMALTWPAVSLVVAGLVRLGYPRRLAAAGPHSLRTALARFVLWLRSTLRQALPMLVVWTAFLLLRTMLVRGIGGYGAAVHMRAGWFLVDDALAYAKDFVSPWIDLARVAGSVTPGGAVQVLAAKLPLGPGLLVIVAAAGGVALARPSALALLTTALLLVPAWNIPTIHRGYFVGVGVALVVATAGAYWLRWVDRRPRGRWVGPTLLAAAACFLLIAQLRAAGARNSRWVEASTWSRTVLSTTSALVAAPADGTIFYYWDLPQTHQGMYVYTWGLSEAVQKHYQNLTLHAYQVYAVTETRRVTNGLERTLADAIAPAESAQVYLVYQPGPQGEPLLTRVTRDEFAAIALASQQ